MQRFLLGCEVDAHALKGSAAHYRTRGVCSRRKAYIRLVQRHANDIWYSTRNVSLWEGPHSSRIRPAGPKLCLLLNLGADERTTTSRAFADSHTSFHGVVRSTMKHPGPVFLGFNARFAVGTFD